MGSGHDRNAACPGEAQRLWQAVGELPTQKPRFVSTKETGDEEPNIPLTFIRAPQIVATGEGVETLVSVDEAPVAVRFGKQIGITFHPELDEDNTLYQLFLGLIDAHA